MRDSLFLVEVSGACVVDQHREAASGELLAQGRDLLGAGYVDMRDLDPSRVAGRDFVKPGVLTPHGAHDVPALCQKLRGHSEPEAARGANDQNDGASAIVGFDR